MDPGVHPPSSTSGTEIGEVVNVDDGVRPVYHAPEAERDSDRLLASLPPPPPPTSSERERDRERDRDMDSYMAKRRTGHREDLDVRRDERSRREDWPPPPAPSQARYESFDEDRYSYPATENAHGEPISLLFLLFLERGASSAQREDGTDRRGERPSRVLFVRNVAYEAREQDVLPLFEKYGPIKKSFMLIEKRGIAFFTYVRKHSSLIM